LRRWRGATYYLAGFERHLTVALNPAATTKWPDSSACSIRLFVVMQLQLIWLGARIGA
jgi:hypothetical protein